MKAGGINAWATATEREYKGNEVPIEGGPAAGAFVVLRALCFSLTSVCSDTT